MRGILTLTLMLGACDYAFRIDRLELDGDGGTTADTSTDVSDMPVDVMLPTCPPSRTGVIAYYPVDGDQDTMQLTDRGPSALHGAIAGSALVPTTGPMDCGQALQIINGREVSIPYSDAFQLAAGSIDLWVRPILTNNNISRVVVARDSGGNNRGDLTLFQHRTGTGEFIFVVRLQSGDQTNNGGGTLRCSNNSLATSTAWYHVTINFGAPGLELKVNGTLQTRTTTITLNGESMVCGQSTTGQSSTVGLDGTPQKPWFIGFGDVYENNAVMRVFLSSGGIDNLRISSERF